MSERPTPADIAAIEARLAALTPGPWGVDGLGIGTTREYPDHPNLGPVNYHPSCEDILTTGTGYDGESFGICGPNREANLVFIAAAPTDIAALLAELAEVQALFAEAEANMLNERGQGDPPSEGWEWKFGAWVKESVEEWECRVSRGGEDHNEWAYEWIGPYAVDEWPNDAGFVCARAAMFAADTALAGVKS